MFPSNNRSLTLYLYGALSGSDMDNERCLKNLRAWPLDCRSYTFVYSHRADLHVPSGYVNYMECNASEPFLLGRCFVFLCLNA